MRRCGETSRLRRCGRARICQEATRGESRCLVNHPGLRVLRVRVEVPSARTNKVVGDAQVDGLGRIQRTDFDRRLIDGVHKPRVWSSEQVDRDNVVGHLGRHRVRHTLRCPIRYDIRGDEAHHGCALGESAEHHLCVGTVRRRGLDMGARVPNAVKGGGEVGGGWVVDRIYRDRFCADLRAQRVHERLPRWTNTGVLGGTAREYHVDVGAGLRGRERNGCDQRRPACCRRRTNDKNHMACPHRAMLTHRDDGGDPKNQQPMNAA